MSGGDDVAVEDAFGHRAAARGAAYLDASAAASRTIRRSTRAVADRR
jgi:hypothetical protein